MGQPDLTGQVAIVTGGSRGIGRATAIALAEQGATVVAVSRTATPVPATTTGTIVSLAADVSVPADIQHIVTETLASHGRIDILINNAGSVPYIGATLEASLADWDATFAINLRGTFLLIQAVVAGWMGAHGGSIVNVASTSGLSGGRSSRMGLGVYGVSKAALMVLTRELAHELGPRHVRVNAVAPSLIQTDFSTQLWDDPATRARMESTIPSGRLGQVEDVAPVIAFLAGPAAGYINGEIITIDGGALA
jgi:NAD(P)-dependent dehydrogenase (short-subunit alcohol dehydrogenase family)